MKCLVLSTALVAVIGFAPSVHAAPSDYFFVCSATAEDGAWAAFGDRTMELACGRLLGWAEGHPFPLKTYFGDFYATHKSYRAFVSCADGNSAQYDGVGWDPMDGAFNWAVANGSNGCVFRISPPNDDSDAPWNTDEYYAHCAVKTETGAWGSGYAGNLTDACATAYSHTDGALETFTHHTYVRRESYNRVKVTCSDGTNDVYQGTGAGALDNFYATNSSANLPGCNVLASHYLEIESCTSSQRAIVQANGNVLCMEDLPPETVRAEATDDLRADAQAFENEFWAEIGALGNPSGFDYPVFEQTGSDSGRVKQPMPPRDQDRLKRVERDGADDAGEFTPEPGLPNTNVDWYWPLGTDFIGAALSASGQFDASGQGNARAKISGQLAGNGQDIVEAEVFGSCQGTQGHFVFTSRVFGQTYYQTPESERDFSTQMSAPDKEWTKRIFEHQERFMVGPVPMLVSVAVDGAVGYTNTAVSANCSSFDFPEVRGGMSPLGRLTGTAFGGADVGVASAGAEGSINFANGRSYFTFSATSRDGRPCLGIGTDIGLLGGVLDLVAKIQYEELEWLDFFSQVLNIKFLEYRHTLFKWDGVTSNENWLFGECGH